MGKGIVYSIGTEGCPCCGCQERTVGCHGTCERYKAWNGKRQAERQERIRRTSILHEADKRKSAAVSHYKRRGRQKGKEPENQRMQLFWQEYDSFCAVCDFQ